MDASDTTPRDGENVTDVSRRQYLGGVAALAAARWDREEYDIENVDEWGPLGNAVFETGSITPVSILSSGRGTVAGWSFDDDDFTDRTVAVDYSDRSDVTLAIEGQADDDIHGGALANLDTDDARDLAATIYQAAEELDRRREAEHGE